MSTTEPCQYSKLTIPTDASYLGVVGAYIRNVAQSFGFDETTCRDIASGVEDVVSKVIEKAFEPNERATLDISCERVLMGLKIVIKDKGLPLQSAEIVPPECESNAKLMFRPQCVLSPGTQAMDEVSFHNLGLEGKETHLINYLQTGTIKDYYNVCELEPYEGPASVRVFPPNTVEFEVRPMQPREAIEVSKCFYKAYGYSFAYRQIYYPDRIVELNEKGEILSVVAVTRDGEIIGHCALLRWDSSSNVAELGFAVVKPEFRWQGCLTRLTEYLIAKAKSENTRALYVVAATNHTYSQQAIHRFGFNDCGLLVGFGPATLSFKGLTETLPQRETYLICFRYMTKLELFPIYAPEHHKEIIRKLYINIGVEPDFEAPSVPGPRFSGPHSRLNTVHYGPTGFGWIDVEEYGSDVLLEVKARLKELCLQHIEVIQLYCSLEDPLTYYMTREFEQLGFFFVGIKPSSSLGDSLILQYFNNVAINYDRIKLTSSLGRELCFLYQETRSEPGVVPHRR